jgi:CDGSH-type Zn-finger protein/uncharacterized Fe-S cluster protein YjdI
MLMASSVRRYRGEKIIVTYDLKRCIHVEECVQGLPPVFDRDRRPWIDPDAASADEVAEVILRCPTGALHFERLDGGPQEIPPDTNTLQIISDGPLYIQGRILIQTPEGDIESEDTRIALCRCGASQNKPYCDNSHLDCNFRDTGLLPEEKVTAQSPQIATGPLRIIPLPNGSVQLQGCFELTDTGGRIFCTDSRAHVCRCGASRTKPFCDGSHREIEFKPE